MPLFFHASVCVRGGGVYACVHGCMYQYRHVSSRDKHQLLPSAAPLPFIS